MQPNQHPKPACLYNPIVVQAQRLNGCATTRGQPFHRVAMLTPGEMLRPTLQSWVKQEDELSVSWIGCLSPRALELVATVTGEAKIVGCRGAPTYERDDMLNDHRNPHDHRASAVRTTLCITFRYLSAYGCRDATAPGHELRICRNGMPVPLQKRQGIRATSDKAVGCSTQFCQLFVLSHCKRALLSLPQQTLMAAPLVLR